MPARLPIRRCLRPRRSPRRLLHLALLLMAAWGALPLRSGSASPPVSALTAAAAYASGMALQKEQRTLEAIEAYRRAIALDPRHGRAHYELGWSYWILGDWAQVVQQWETALQLKVDEPDLPTYLAQARSRLNGEGPAVVRVPMNTKAGGGGLTLELVRRYQHYDPQPASPDDHFDGDIFSPKSVNFTPDGGKAYVNSLEGGSTAVYDVRSGAKLATVSHRMGPNEEALFDAQETAQFQAAFTAGHAPPLFNRFLGKPVESVFTHSGRYLWISYYRRDYDRDSVLPSAVAIVDTRTDRIVRVMHTGPIPKFLAASPDGHWLAAIHWGDNTVGLIDISAPDPAGFRHAGELVVERKLPLELNRHVDRDRYCGYCLRGAVFTRDSRHLLVARMGGGGGIAVLDVAARAYLGSVLGMPPTPRHLVLSGDGTRLYVGSNTAGRVSVYRPEDLVRAAEAHAGKLAPLLTGATGNGTRTIDLSPDGTLLFAAVNRESKLVVLDAATLVKRLEIAVDSYPVGLGVAPEGDAVWVTSQGVKLQGGNSVSVYRLTRGG